MPSKFISNVEPQTICSKKMKIGELARCVGDSYRNHIVVKIYGEKLVCVWRPSGNPFACTWSEDASLEVILLGPTEKVELYNE